MEAHDPAPPKDYYKILEVDYDATDDKIRLNYRKLALKWHPDKHKGDGAVTSKFQEINEAYRGEVLLTFNDLIRHWQQRALGNGIFFVVILFYTVVILFYANEVLSDPVKRFDYDLTGIYEIEKYTLREYLARFKGMILTCNGLGIGHPSEGAEHLTNGGNIADE